MGWARTCGLLPWVVVGGFLEGRVVLDGSFSFFFGLLKLKANASKHKAMSYGRMQEDEKRI